MYNGPFSELVESREIFDVTGLTNQHKTNIDEREEIPFGKTNEKNTECPTLPAFDGEKKKKQRDVRVAYWNTAPELRVHPNPTVQAESHRDISIEYCSITHIYNSAGNIKRVYFYGP